MSQNPQVLLDFESAPVTAQSLPANRTASLYREDVKTIDEKDSTLAADVQILAAESINEDAETPDDGVPTEHEMETLRKVAAPMKWAAIAMCIIELAERASYYGSKGPFGNFVRGKLPEGGPGTGAVAHGPAGYNQSAGALGLGSRAATAVTESFTFLSYCIPILGGIVSDTKWGRFKTIVWGTALGAVAHILLVIPAIPSVISSGKALGPFVISYVMLAFAAGFIKPCLAPLLCDQSPVTRPTIKTLKDGERVIVDPQTTVSRYLLIFYFCINVGAFFALATSYAAHDIGFWLAFLTPGIFYMLMPIVLVMCSKSLYKAPAQGSVVLEAMKVGKILFSNGGWRRLFGKKDAFWNYAKPSEIEKREGPLDLSKVFWDDQFVDEMKATVAACKAFLLIPIFNLANGGLGNSENAMSSAMQVGNVPNDLISNFNPLTIVIFAPILNYVFYPWMARIGYPLAPMTRMTIGFALAGINMIVGAILQWQVEQSSPCGVYATSDCAGVSDVSLWAQIPLYSLPAIGELFVNVSSYELAYTRAPARMKSLIYALVLFTSAISSAIGLALTPVVIDPYLKWPYVALAAACFACCPVLMLCFKDLNKPVTFNDIDRMEGRQQPAVLAAAKRMEAEAGGSSAVDFYREEEKIAKTA
ncbi:hypothetical protein NCC49_004950 [Naganishia albida]|nr:hypothetical protein NCC49_004950 [Naganishia albida]